MSKVCLDVTRVIGRSGLTLGTRLSVQRTSYTQDKNVVLIEALKQLRPDEPRKATRVMIDFEVKAGWNKLIEQVLSIPPCARERTTLLVAMGAEGLSDAECKTIVTLRDRTGVGLAVIVEKADSDGCLDALDLIDPETIILGRSMVIPCLEAGCSMEMLDIAELCEKKGSKLVVQGDLTEQQMATLAGEGVTGFLGRRFETALTILSLEEGVFDSLAAYSVVPDHGARSLLQPAATMRALPN